MRPRRSRSAALALLVLGAGIAEARGAVVTLQARQDNTLYETVDGSLSDGAGDHLFAGRTAGGALRRALLAFDVAAAVPAGATIVRADLTLSMSRTRLTTPVPVSLHRLLADWGEGTSNSNLNEGMGAPSTPGDATWIHRFYDTLRWSAPGGDFVAQASATIMVGPIGTYTWLSTPQMVADVQAWLDDPGGSFGWILRGDESVLTTAKRFDSRENPSLQARPVLSVEFGTAVQGAGRVPDGSGAGEPLRVAAGAGGDLTLTWGASCLATDTDFAVYEGRIGDFRSHVPRLCGTGGARTASLSPAAGGTYYLIVPRNDIREGSYGLDRRGIERPASASACLPQEVTSCP